MRGEPPHSSSEVELAELMERSHVNTAKYSSLIYHDSLCSMVLLLKNTLIISSITYINFLKAGVGRGFGKLDRLKGKESYRDALYDQRREEKHVISKEGKHRDAALKTCFSTVTNTVITMICQNFQRAARHFDSHVRTNTATTPLHTHTHKQKA